MTTTPTFSVPAVPVAVVPATPAPVSVPVSVASRASLGQSDVRRASEMLEGARPDEIVRWAHDQFGDRLAMTASFADTALIDVATAVVPDVEVIFVDTGYHFAETLETMRAAFERYSLNLTVLRPDRRADDVWAVGASGCCNARKVQPLDDYLPGRVDAWMSGVRRADSASRSQVPIVSVDRRGLVKINPLANLGDADLADYVDAHRVLVNPLAAQGYASIGCWPCTEPDSGRAGRWSGTEKTECGLHL